MKQVLNALKEELKDFPVVAKFATTASDGKTYQVEYYNLIVKNHSFLDGNKRIAAGCCKIELEAPPDPPEQYERLQ